MPTVLERLQDPNERFSPAELYPVFEAIAEQYGYYRDERLPKKGETVETASMTVDGYEHFGVLVVRPRTVRDTMITIPGLCDKILGGNLEPSTNTLYNAQMVALAQTVIVSPVDIVDRVLSSSKPEDIGFFLAFAQEYGRWIQHLSDESSKKKSGQKGKKGTGTESNS